VRIPTNNALSGSATPGIDCLCRACLQVGPVRKQDTSAPATPAPNRRAFWDKHPGLVWSNRNAPDDAFISAALREGRFLQLLDIAVEFGIKRLLRQWELEKAEGDLPPRLIFRVEENLAIIEEAYAKSAAGRNGPPLAQT
jgi:hypothetical protein